MAHKTLINGTSYDIKSGRTLIGGTGYDIKKGRTLIDGTEYDIKFGVPVGELAVGTSVYMNVGDVRKEWLVVHQGNLTPKYYDDTCYGTWLLLKDIYTLIKHGGANYYENSQPDKYLTETFLPLLEPQIQALIKQINLPIIDRRSSAPAVTVPRKIFLLDRADLGVGHWANETDVPLSYFPDATSSTREKRVAYYNGEATDWYLRSDIKSSTGLTGVHKTGSLVYVENNISTTVMGIRPALVLPQEDAKFDDSFNII